MTTRIGRLVLADRPLSYQVGPEEVTLVGTVFAETLQLAEVWRQQVSDLGSFDEPIVPVLVEDGFSGFGRVSSVKVSAPSGSMAGAWFNYSVEVETLRPSRRPQILSALDQRVRENVNSVSSVAAQHAVPSDVEAWSWMPTATAQQETRQTAPGPAGGDVLYRRAVSGTGQTEARWLCSPEHWYQGACSVTRRVDHVDVPVVGRQSLADAWRATNGLVECWLTSTGRLSVRWWMPSGGWTPTTSFLLGSGGGFSFAGWRGVEVDSMTAQRVKLRAQGVRAQGRTSLYVTLHRGSRTVSVTIDTDSVPGHSVKPDPAEAVTEAGTPGWHVYQTTADAGSDDCHWLITAADNFDVNTTTGQVDPDNALAPTWSFGISAYFTGASGDTGDREMTARDWYATRSEQVQIG